jgi:UDP-3-O-[3-hydroxymyristoyl] glucosamine N-acyltransferase
MSEASFFNRRAGLTLREIIALTGAEAHRCRDLDRRISGIAAPDRAAAGDLCFIDKSKFVDQAASSDAGACLTLARLADRIPERIDVLCTDDPYRAFVQVARALFPDALRPSSLYQADAVAAGAVVHPSARLESGVTVDPGAMVGPGAEIGSGTLIGAGAVIGPNVRIGRDCAVGANVALTHALIGDRVIIHSGCQIGQDGFGYVMGAAGHVKVPQIGRVIVQDDVEIGAGCTIDRGGIRDTVIGEGTKIDNLVQIGHNVSIGRHCVIVSQCGISGSAVIEDHAVLAGQVGVADHLVVGEGAVVGARSGLMSDVPAGETWLGYPAMRGRDFLRSMMTLRRWVTEADTDAPAIPGGGAGRHESARRAGARPARKR